MKDHLRQRSFPAACAAPGLELVWLWRILGVALLGIFCSHLPAATVQTRYYGHEAVHDEHGVVAPWYQGLNGPCDLRVRIAAETLKRFPWTTMNDAVAAYPHYVFTGWWQIATNGVITPKTTTDWANGDLGQRATSVLNGFVDYYRYTGDPAAIAHVTYMADYLLDHCLTPPEHPWPRFFISVPVKGKTYGKTDPAGMIQLDIVGSTGQGLLRAYQLTGNKRWLDAAKHWGDLLVAHCNREPAAAPWPRYANPEAATWKDPTVNKQTGGAVMIVAFLEELLRLGYTGKDGSIVTAWEAGQRYLRDRLLPAWAINDTWGRYFWDWVNPVQTCSIPPEAARYILEHKDYFRKWRTDVRNMVTLFLNRSSVNPASNGDVYSGAWAFPEANNCCGRSLWYGPFIVAPALAQYAVDTNDAWCRELAYRMMVLQTYDIHETGVSEDNIDGGTIVNGSWLNIAHPLPLRFMLAAMAWLPEELGASRENHIMRSTAVVNSVIYGKGRVEYSTFDAPEHTVDVLRLAFVPKQVTADGRRLELRQNLDSNGYMFRSLANGDTVVTVRHDGAEKIAVTGDDPQQTLDSAALAYEGEWKTDGAGRVTESSGAAVVAKFEGNQVRLIGRAGPDGGLADVFLDGQKQLVPIDAWTPAPRSQQVLYYRNGLSQGPHILKVVARGARNPYSTGNRFVIDAVQYSAANERGNYPTGGGPKNTQRMIFGYTEREDYRDSQGSLWRPGTEVVTRTGGGADSIATSWWITPATNVISGTSDPELYRYGIHGRDFWVNATIGPGRYYVRLKFAATRGLDTRLNCFDIHINGERVVKKFDVAGTAGEPGRAADLVFNDIAPRNGVIEVRFKGARVMDGEKLVRGEASVQALELGPGDGGKGLQPVSSSAPEPRGNLLMNPGFEDTQHGTTMLRGERRDIEGWTYQFAGPMKSYIWQERDYQKHAAWGLPEFHGGKGAIRTHSDGNGHTMISQDVEVTSNTRYTASVWVRAVDLHGKGFGQNKKDSAGLVIMELDNQGKVVRRHDKAEVKTAGPYTQLAKSFTAGVSTAQVRFILDTLIHCSYQEGHVTYDDCWFAADSPGGAP